MATKILRFAAAISSLASLIACQRLEQKFCNLPQVARYQAEDGEIAEFESQSGSGRLQYRQIKGGRLQSSVTLPRPVRNDGKQFYITGIVKINTDQFKVEYSKNSECIVKEKKYRNDKKLWLISCFRNNNININKFTYDPHIGITSIETSCKGCAENQKFQIKSEFGIARQCQNYENERLRSK